MKNKLLFTLFAVTFITGCSSISQDIKETWDYSRQKHTDTVVTPEQLAEFPYTAMYIKVGQAPRTVLVLGFIDPVNEAQRLSWVSGGNETIVTDVYRVIRTAGLPTNLVGVSHLQQDPLRCFVYNPQQLSECAMEWRRDVDIVGDDGAKTDTIVSQFKVVGPETIELVEGTKETTRIEESGFFVYSGNFFTNVFWMEPSGHVVKSKQQVVHGLPSFELTQLKWIGSDE